MARPKKLPADRLSVSAVLRLWSEEKEGLNQLAEILGETRSGVLRRLVRLGVMGGPDFFEDGHLEMRAMRIELTKRGRHLNELARAVNRGEPVDSEELTRTLNACTVRTEAVKQLYIRDVRAAYERVWGALSEGGGRERLAASTTTAAARSGSRPPE